MRKLFYLLLVLGFITACNSNESTNNSTEASYEDALAKMQNTYQTIVVEEALQSGNYTYIRYHQDGKEYWGAISARPVEIGQKYYYQNAMEMKNFESKSLDRVFPSIWFINDFTDSNPQMSQHTNVKADKSDNLAGDHNKAKDVHQKVEVDKIEGGYSLAEVFEMKSKLEGKDVLVKGQVVKINENIMNTNWVHIQDGTSFNDLFDLTITTNNPVNFKIGDVVTFKGKLVLNKDFGYGYKYDYLIENATIQ